MMNGRSTARASTPIRWGAGTGALVAALLLTACAGTAPPRTDEAAEAIDSAAMSATASKLVAAAAAADHDTGPAVGSGIRWPATVVSVSSVPDGDDGAGFAGVAALLPPPMFTPAQAAAEAAAAADLATEPAAENQASGGPSIRFRKPFGERGLPGEGEEVDRGTASWYGLQFHGRRTANGERYDMYDLTAAHKTLPFNTIVSVHNLQTGRSVKVRINDRGPFVDGRVIDLSKAAAEQLGMAEVGLRPVSLVVEEWPAEVSGVRDSKRPTSRSNRKSRSGAPQIEGP